MQQTSSKYSVKDNRELIKAIRDGDKDAFAEYYTRFVDVVVLFLNKILGNIEEAKEITQDVFIKLWETRASIDPDKRPEGFIYTIAKNMAFNVIRRRHVHSQYHNEQKASSDPLSLSADETVISRETELLIKLIIDKMPAQRRKVFEMSRNNGLTYEQIAEQLELSIDTVKTHMKLALKDIREAVSVITIFALMLLS